MNVQRGIRFLLADVDDTLVTGDKVLIEAASAVTDGNENEGFASAVRKFILQPIGDVK